VWRRHAWYLWCVAAVLLAPLALIELAGVAPSLRIDTGDLDLPTIISSAVVALVFEVLTAEVLAAAAERTVATEVRGAPLPSVRRFLRELPWISLVVATVLYEVTVAIGLLLLVIPGYFAFVAGSIYGPVVVVERCSPLRALRRSRELVRGSFWRVAFLVTLALVVAQSAALLTGIAFSELPDRWAHVLGSYAVAVVLSPLFGVGVAVLYYALRERVAERSGRETGPAVAGPGT
jgi:hypothetical protein